MSGSPWESIPLEAKEPERFRQSLLTTADACPYAAGLYTQGMVPGHPLYRGSVLHETFDRATKTLAEHGQVQMAPDDVKAILEEVVRDHPDWVVPAAEWDGMRVMAHHWATHFRLPKGALSEVPYVLEVGGKTLTGTIDLLWVEADTLFIRDAKSGWDLYSQDSVSGKDSASGKQRGSKSSQLTQYMLGVVDGTCDGFALPRGVNQFDVAFTFPMFATDLGIVERGVIVTRPELIEHRTWLETLVARTQHAFREQKFTAVPGSHCKRCPAPTECPIPQRAKGTGPFERDPREVAEEWFRQKAEVDRLFAELKQYVQVMGPVEFGTDQVLELQQIVSDRTPKKVKEAILAGEVLPAGQIYKQSVSTRFGARKR